MHTHETRRLEPGEKAPFGHEALAQERDVPLPRTCKGFQREMRAEPLVHNLVHAAHAARAERPHHAVAAYDASLCQFFRFQIHRTLLNGCRCCRHTRSLPAVPSAASTPPYEKPASAATPMLCSHRAGECFPLANPAGCFGQVEDTSARMEFAV